MMPNLEKVLIWYADLLKKHYEESEKIFKNEHKNERKNELYHNGEYGRYREEACRDFVQFIIPGKFSVGEGFLVNADPGDKSISTQCDIVVFDKSTPMFKNSHIRFFPVETTAAIGEVKSTLDTTNLIEALIKLAKNKRMRTAVEFPYTFTYRNTQFEDHYKRIQLNIDNLLTKELYEQGSAPFFSEKALQFLIYNKLGDLGLFEHEVASLSYRIMELREIIPLSTLSLLLDDLVTLIHTRESYRYNPYQYYSDHMMSFLICKKIKVENKKVLMAKIEAAYEKHNINLIHRHNIILSLEDGIFLYHDSLNTPLSSKKMSWPYPMMSGQKFEQRFIPVQATDPYYHVKQFAHHLFSGVAEVSIMNPETAAYFKWDNEDTLTTVDFDSNIAKLPFKKRSNMKKPKAQNKMNGKKRNKSKGKSTSKGKK